MQCTPIMRKRAVTEEQQHKCQYLVLNQGALVACAQPATTGCTDSIVDKDGKRTQSKMRYGCPYHPVVPLYYYRDGRWITWEVFVNGNS